MGIINPDPDRSFFFLFNDQQFSAHFMSYPQKSKITLKKRVLLGLYQKEK